MSPEQADDNGHLKLMVGSTNAWADELSTAP
jgi:hypothetical protein